MGSLQGYETLFRASHTLPYSFRLSFSWDQAGMYKSVQPAAR